MMTDSAPSLRDHALATMADSQSLRQQRAGLLAAHRSAMAQQKTLREQTSALTRHCADGRQAMTARAVRWRALLALLPPDVAPRPMLPAPALRTGGC